MSKRFPAEFPKDELFELGTIIIQNPAGAYKNPEVLELALYAAGCFNAMRFQSVPVGVAGLPVGNPFVIMIATELLRRVLGELADVLLDGAPVPASTEAPEDLTKLPDNELAEKLCDDLKKLAA